MKRVIAVVLLAAVLATSVLVAGCPGYMKKSPKPGTPGGPPAPPPSPGPQTPSGG